MHRLFDRHELTDFGSVSYQLVPMPFEDHGQVAEIENLISRKDYATIIKSEKLFWEVFCYSTILVDAEKKFEKEHTFSITNSNGNFKVTGEAYSIKEIKTAMNVIRSFYENALKNREDFDIVLPKVTHHLFFRAPQETIELRDWTSEKIFSIIDFRYTSYIEPYLEKMSQFIGTVCSTSIKKQNIMTLFLDSVDTEVIHVSWKRDVLLIYPIPPVKVELDEGAKSAFYPLYKDQILCDLQFRDKNKTPIIKAHAAFLYLYGGEMMKKLLTSKMKESQTRKVCLEGFDKNVVRAYTDFIYMPLEEFNKKYSQKGSCDLIQLFRLAQTYQLEPLIHCCTNLMSLLCGPEDVEAIQSLAELYDNTHLKKLAAYLQPLRVTSLKPAEAGVGAGGGGGAKPASSSSSSSSFSASSSFAPQNLKGLDEDEDMID